MCERVSDYFGWELAGRTVYTIIKDRIHDVEVRSGWIPDRNKQKQLQEILLIDNEDLYGDINDVIMYINPTELFLNKKDAQKEIFKRKLKG